MYGISKETQGRRYTVSTMLVLPSMHVNVVDQNNQLNLQAKLNVGCNWTSPFPKSNGLVSI